MYVILVRFLSEYLLFFLFLPIFYFLRKRDYQTVIRITASVILTYLLRKTVGVIWYEPRPFVIDPERLIYPTHKLSDSSFFSTHASVAAALAGSIFWGNKQLGLLIFSGAVLVAAGRVLAALHYPIDVIIGTSVGVAVSFLVEKKSQVIFKKWEERVDN